VTVLFADLVGFTRLSEDRDPEDVRELLSSYFERCRELIERYGGTVEKFIGDAVMAVWGTPSAREDDAERAVRAALDLVSAVRGLGEEVRIPELRLRAGLVTGETAVNVAAQGEGMVMGDVVNTAARVQTLAEPGTVLVDEVTRRASEAALTFEEAGTHEVKGRHQPVHVFRALRVVAYMGGAARDTALEAPLVGREAEMQRIVDAFHEVAMEGRAALLSVMGQAGIGKSRLTWELEKYVDALTEVVLWHSGRSLSYGDGVAFWALVDMVRMRAGILEDEEAADAQAKLRAAVERYVADESERQLVEPRLATLLGLKRGVASDQADLFSGWRLFFERLADEAPVVMVFEDVHRADSGLLDFIEYLLEWSSDKPILMVTLGRPELSEKREGWGASRSGADMLWLEPLAAEQMEELVGGLLPGVPGELRARIGERAEGVPLYASEMARMLVDRGLLERRGERYEPTEPVEDLDVPATLQALIAARLDALPARERRLLQDAAVLGTSFPAAGLVTVSGLPEPEVHSLLQGLLAKQFLSLNTDPRSPERGHYAFLQALVARVAYGRLARRDRKERHLRAARFLHDVHGEEPDEIAEVLATHYQEAAIADPDAADVEQITASARATLEAAGARAMSLAAGERAAGYFVRAAHLATEPVERAGLLEQAGEAAELAGRADEAREHFDGALTLLRQEGDDRRAAGVLMRIAEVDAGDGCMPEAIEGLEAAYATLLQGDSDADLAAVAERLARAYAVAGYEEKAEEHVEVALVLAERLRLFEIIAGALSTKHIVLARQGRLQEAVALLRHSLHLALENDAGRAALIAYNNLAWVLASTGQQAAAVTELERGVELARRRGDRRGEDFLLAMMTLPLFHVGRWDEALAAAEEVTRGGWDTSLAAIEAISGSVFVRLHRGEVEGLDETLELLASGTEGGNVEALTLAARGQAAILNAQGEHAAALKVAEHALGGRADAGLDPSRQELLVEALAASLGLADRDGVASLLERIDALLRLSDAPYLAAQAERFRGRLAALGEGPAAAGPHFQNAEAAFREMDNPFDLAVVSLEHAEELGSGEDAATMRKEARATFERLGARPWLERAAGASSVRTG
jgi:class 3 adenylate cyclase/tetratricopeptide (TPR) repeat protein